MEVLWEVKAEKGRQLYDVKPGKPSGGFPDARSRRAPVRPARDRARRTRALPSDYCARPQQPAGGASSPKGAAGRELHISAQFQEMVASAGVVRAGAPPR